MDDGGIIGDVELLRKVWKLLLKCGPALGLHLQPVQMRVVLARSGALRPLSHRVAFVAHSQIQMLGVPLGCDVFVAGFVDKKFLERLVDAC